jgi:malignant T-cell-amplified sequence
MQVALYNYCRIAAALADLITTFWRLSLVAIAADPFILPHVRIDRGAIRFLLGGAHMMCPGLTSAGGSLPPADAALPAGTPVAFDAEGKESAVGIGLTKLGTEEMKKVNKGVAVESVTYVGDDLWAIQKLG